jgi:hypothetical protein
MGKTVPKSTTKLVNYSGVGPCEHQLTVWDRNKTDIQAIVDQLGERSYEIRRKRSGHIAVFVNNSEYQLQENVR